MSMINTIQERLRIPALLLVAFSLFTLAGCGSEATGKSTITVETGILLPDMTTTASATKTQHYRVSVADSSGLLLNGIDVNFMAAFTSGTAIIFGSAPTGTAPVTGLTTEKTGKWGLLDFTITVPYYVLKTIQPPSGQIAVSSVTGGQLADGNYCYTVTALDFAGQTDALAANACALVTNTTTTIPLGSVTVSWQAVPGATGYKVYGRGVTGLVKDLSGATTLSPTVTWLDTGAAPLGSVDAASLSNTTGLSRNSVIGTAQATSGTALSTFDINF